MAWQVKSLTTTRKLQSMGQQQMQYTKQLKEVNTNLKIIKRIYDSRALGVP